MRCRDQAGAAHRPGEGAGWLFPSHQPSRRGAPCPARPCPAPAPRPTGPAFLAGACGFLPAPGARSWLAAGRGARGEREEASAREGRQKGAPWEEFQPLLRARPPRGLGGAGQASGAGDSAGEAGSCGPAGGGAGLRNAQAAHRVPSRPPPQIWPGCSADCDATETGTATQLAGRAPLARPFPHLHCLDWGPGACS